MHKFVLTILSAALTMPLYAQLTKAQQDSVAKELVPITDKAIIYVLRPSSFGALVNMKVLCDSIQIGSTKAGQFVYTIVAPGQHSLISKAENEAAIDINVEAGKIYYVKQKVKMGILYAETGLQLIDENEGRGYLKKCKLSKDNLLTN